MTTDPDNSKAAESIAGESIAASGRAGPVDAGPNRTGPGSPWNGLRFGLVAGFVTFLVVQMLHPVFDTQEGRDEWGFLPLNVQWALDRNNSMFVLGLLAGLSAVGLAVANAATRRRWILAAGNSAVCAAAAIPFGALAGFLGHRLFEALRSQDDMPELTKAMCVFGVMLGLAGAGAGLGAGWVFGRQARAAIRGLVAGALAGALSAIIYPIAMAAFLPKAMTSVLIPVEAIDRLCWTTLAAALTGLIVTAVALPRAPVRGQDP